MGVLVSFGNPLDAGVDDVDEGRLQAGTANQETVNIGLGSELTAVLLADRATVNDANALLSVGGDSLAEPLADSGVDLLSLLSGGDLSSANSPDRLVGNDDLVPLLCAQLLGGSVKLTGDDLDGLVGLTLLEGLSDTEDDRDTALNGGLGLAGNEIIRLLQDHSALAVADNNPVDLGIAELLNTDLTGESTVGLVVNVLGSDTNLGVGQLAGQSEVDGGRRDDDLGAVVKLGGIEVLHDFGDALSNTVPL